MKQCDGCKIKYPEELLSPMYTDQGITKDICGICALNLRNHLLGTKQTKFNGEIAEQMRLDAIEFRKKNKIKI